MQRLKRWRGVFEFLWISGRGCPRILSKWLSGIVNSTRLKGGKLVLVRESFFIFPGMNLLSMISLSLSLNLSKPRECVVFVDSSRRIIRFVLFVKYKGFQRKLYLTSLYILVKIPCFLNYFVSLSYR